MLYLPWKSSKGRIRVAQHARNNRLEIVKARSIGQISRRDLLKWGLITSGGALAWKQGLNPFVRSAYASIPTGLPRSPLFGVQAFSTPMPRFDVLARENPAVLNPAPTKEANTTQQLLDPALPGVAPGDTGPVEGRPPGPIWAHQRWEQFLPQVAIQVTEEGAKTNTSYNPGVAPQHNSGINPATPVPYKFHAGWPTQEENSSWTYNGTQPPKLAIVKYGEPVLFRVRNKLPADITQNNGFGRHTTSVHEHNAHHGAENDGFTGAFFFPNQFYDYHWPWVLAGIFSGINEDATDIRASTPNGSGGLMKVPGDWRETMSSHWFHDHMFEHTAENVYKGLAGMTNIYSGLDRGNEAINDGVNLRLPSGRLKDFGNLEYDVNLMLADKAFDNDGQLVFDIFDTDGFLGDVATVNNAYKPFFNVERRKYRFRILNGSVARFWTISLSDASPMIQIGNDGNLLPKPVVLTKLDQLGVAERYDIVIDFSRYPIGARVSMVNLAEHNDGREVHEDLTLGEALFGQSDDPVVGKFLEFRVVRNPAQPDISRVPAVLIPNPDLSNVPVARERIFEFGRGANQTIIDPGPPPTASEGPWGIKTGDGDMLAAAFSRVSAQPRFGTREVWTLRNGGGGWDHPIHIHFEEGQILERDGSLDNVPQAERGRKDVYRLRPGGTVKITMQFRDWQGMFMQHCHNTTHEDHAMLMRWEINDGGAPFLRPLPTPIPRPQGVIFRAPEEILNDNGEPI
jgi:FtsP/CotA-like multicopper oxidase with cupredoxin domain